MLVGPAEPPATAHPAIVNVFTVDRQRRPRCVNALAIAAILVDAQNRKTDIAEGTPLYDGESRLLAINRRHWRQGRHPSWHLFGRPSSSLLTSNALVQVLEDVDIVHVPQERSCTRATSP